MYIDTDVIYAFIKPADRHIRFARRVAGLVDEELYTSSITLLEVEFVRTREFVMDPSRELKEIIYSFFPRLKIVPFTHSIFSESESIRKKHKMGILDSIHAATALSADKRIASTDHIFDKISGLKRFGPENLI